MRAGFGPRSVRLLCAATLAAWSGGLLVAVSPASAGPAFQDVVAFSGGPATFPNTGSVSSSVCVSDSVSCSVSLSIATGGATTASGTGTIVDGTETITFQWQSNPTTSGGPFFPETLLPGGVIIGNGTDQTGQAWFVEGPLAGSATGGTIGALYANPTTFCDPSRTGDTVCDSVNQAKGIVDPISNHASTDSNAAGLIADYVAKGTSSGAQFTASTTWNSTTFCHGAQSCALTLNGTGSVPPTTDNPATYTASGTGTLDYGSETVNNLTFQLSTALCNPDGLILALGLGDESTCGYLTGSGTTTTGTAVNVAGAIQVGGFGSQASTAYPFPTIRGSLVIGPAG